MQRMNFIEISFKTGRGLGNKIIVSKMNTDKFKIEVILRSSPDKLKQGSRDRAAKYPKDANSILTYPRSPSLPANPDIDLRSRIINPKQCLQRPVSKKQKQSQLFTEKCLDILSRKKNTQGGQEKSKVQTMMNNIIEKYRHQTLSTKAENFDNFADSPVVGPRAKGGYTKFSGYEDKVEVYRMIKSTDVGRQKDSNKAPIRASNISDNADWRLKPDVTGVRMNNRLLKSQPHDIQGVTCFSLSIEEAPMLKRHSMIIPHTATFQQQPRTLSSNSNRRKVSITRANSQKFMAFSMSSDPDALYMKKLKAFLDFIFKVNYSNQIYISLQLSEDTANIKRYKVWLGRGNNSLLIRSLLKRRFWLEIVDEDEEEGINFYWSQNKIKKVHSRQSKSKNAKMVHGRESLKRKEPKSAEQREMLELNKKILSSEDCHKAEKFISRDGFTIPYDEKYFCNILTNHIPGNSCIGSKKNLFKSMLHYYRDYLKTDPFDVIPMTYNVRGPEDPEFKRFWREHGHDAKKVWIIKPGENSNRGNGIKLAQTSRVAEMVRKKEKHANGQTKTYIIQSYINKPFLYNGRKFDIRHYMMLTSVNGVIKAYWYKEGYIRTSSQKFDLEDLSNEVVHLTNDAIQKNYEDYEKYEPGNKLSYSEFQRYLDMAHSNRGFNFERDIIPKMKSVMTDVVKANYNILDRSRRECNFEIFGFDFMLDREFKPWLIEVNFNPCLEMSCPLLSRIIPVMVENSLRLGLDPLLPPLNHYPVNKRFSLSDNYLRILKYEMMFDESTFDETIPDLFDPEDSQEDDEEEEYCDEGKELEELII